MKLNPPKILVTGAAGMLGSEICRQLAERGVCFVGAVHRNSVENQITLDVTDANAIAETMNQQAPTIVVNCAAYTGVDKAESEEDIAARVNGTGPGHLAAACKRQNAFLVQVSTDYVFSGQGDRPWRAEDPTDPQTAYGRGKLAGEHQVQQQSDKWAIVRTSWLFGPRGKNFVDTIARLAVEKDELKVVNDQTGCPTYTVDLAGALIDLGLARAQGIWHFCNPPSCTWFDLARKAVAIVSDECTISPCRTEDYPRPARRPAYSVLDCQATFTRLGRQPRSWEQALSHYLKGVAVNT